MFEALQKEHQKQLESDITGNVAQYGLSCLLKLMTPDNEKSATGSEDEELLTDISSDDEMSVNIETGFQHPILSVFLSLFCLASW